MKYAVIAGFFLVILFSASTHVPNFSLSEGYSNLAQVLAVFVNNPDVPADSGGGGDSGGGSGGGGGGGSSSGGGGGGGGGGVTPPASITPSTGGGKGDFTGDGKVDISDFSILAYWYKRPLTAAALARGVDLNHDGKVTLADFSILAYYWNR